MKISILFVSLLVSLLPNMGLAQAYPVKPIVVILPFAAGGGMDLLANAVAQRLSVASGTRVVVDFKPGANAMIGSEYVARSAPDGYTLLITTTSFLLHSHLYSKLPYDPRDLVPVAGLLRTPFAVAVTPSLPVSTMRELIALARTKPGQLTYASAGIGTALHLVVEMLQSEADIRLTHIPYKGTSPAVIDVSTGRVDIMANDAGTVLQQAKAGKLKVIAVTSSSRSVLFPQVETIAESGVLSGFDAVGSWHLHAPAGVPRGIIEKINVDVRRILSVASFRATALDPQGWEPILMAVPEFDAFLKAEEAKWSKIVRQGNIKLE